MTSLALLVVYLLTLAPGITPWDSAELITAIHTLGIPHPPGTPLFVVVGRVWTLILAPLGVAQAANSLSAVATAASCGLLASLMHRWIGSGVAAFAAGISAGLASTVWLNATETEVYAVALLLAAITLVVADRAGRSEELRWSILVVYLMSLAIPLHLFALVVAPGAVVLAATNNAGRWRPRRALLLSAMLLGVIGVGTLRVPLLVASLAVVLALEVHRLWHGGKRGGRAPTAPALPMLVVAVVGLSAVAILVIRARFDPFLNEGDPGSLTALADVLARRQYSVASVWPRQAPFWLQLGNVLEYADWQFALALAPGPMPGWGRTVITLLFAALGLVGARTHRRQDRRSWRAMAIFMAAATVGVVLYLNLKAGPTFGHGVLATGTPREARERDYFFIFAFWLWGAWAALGAASISLRLGDHLRSRSGSGGAGRLLPTVTTVAGLLVAASPVALNWSAVDRRRGVDAAIATDVGRALLDAAPAGAILLTAGDLDSYPIWYLQGVAGLRPDVTIVVVPMLPARWYRAELGRRQQLLTEAGQVDWPGSRATLDRIVDAAAQQGRPVAASALLPAGVLEAPGREWIAAGVINLLRDEDRTDEDDVVYLWSGLIALDTATAARTVALVRSQLPHGGPLPPSTDPAARRMRSLLECARLVEGGVASPAASATRALLDSRCNLP